MNNDNCLPGTVCNASGVCAPVFSVGGNQQCNPNVQWECTYGLYCNAGFCTPSLGVKACTSDADCTDHGTSCVCARDGSTKCQPTQQSIAPNCAGQLQTAIACQIANQCITLSDDPLSCAFQKCPFQIGCLYQCMAQSSDPLNAIYNCNVSPTYTCVVVTTGPQYTLLTVGYPLPTLPKPYGSGAAELSKWIVTAFVLAFLLW